MCGQFRQKVFLLFSFVLIFILFQADTPIQTATHMQARKQGTFDGVKVTKSAWKARSDNALPDISVKQKVERELERERERERERENEW